MPRLAANLSMMFNEVPFIERFEAAAACGFTAVECVHPYGETPAALRAGLRDAGLEMVLFNTLAGDWAKGERGVACQPGRQAEFRDAISRALDYATAMECKLVHAMAGIAPDGVAHDTLTAIFAANMAWAIEQARGTGVVFTFEPINHRDMPGYFMNRLAQAEALVRALGADATGIQFDVYHTQITEGDVTSRLATHLPLVRHIQIADVPARNEPGTGEVGWEFVLRRIDELGYTGWVGCEYRPAGDTVAGLAWRARYGVS